MNKEQENEVEKMILDMIDLGMNDKQDIYTKVTEKLNVPRPTVKRVARDLRNKLLKKVSILQSDIPRGNK